MKQFKRKLSNIAALEVTNDCNFTCSSCVVWYKKKKDYITMDTVHKACKLFKEMGFLQVQLYWRGEPCLHPQLPEIAEVVKSYDLITIVSTNNHTPNNADKYWMERLLKHTDHYAVCLDGWNEATISSYRRGSDWNQFFSNVELIKKSKCDKILLTLMFGWNSGKEKEFEKIAKKYGMRNMYIAPDILGKPILSAEEAAYWMCDYNTAYIKKKANRLPKVRKWRGHEITKESFSGDVYVYDELKYCKEGNIVVSATGEIAACPQMPNMEAMLGTVNDSSKTITENYKAIENDLYYRTNPHCKEFCLCLRK